MEPWSSAGGRDTQDRGLRPEWDAFVDSVAATVHSAPRPGGASPKALAQSAARYMAPMVRVLAQALLIRLERKAKGGGVSPELFEQQAALSRCAAAMLLAARPRVRDPRVRLFLSRLGQERARSRPDVAAFAREAGMSARGLSRLVCRETCLPIQQHIRCRRLLDAAHLLSKTYLTIGEIAVLAGYGTQRRLERCFESVLGVRPLDYRSYGLREACRAHMRGRDDALFARWARHRLPMLVTRTRFVATEGLGIVTLGGPEARGPARRRRVRAAHTSRVGRSPAWAAASVDSGRGARLESQPGAGP